MGVGGDGFSLGIDANVENAGNRFWVGKMAATEKKMNVNAEIRRHTD